MTKLEAIKTLASAITTGDALSEAMRVAIMAVAEASEAQSSGKVVSEEPAPEPEKPAKPTPSKKPGPKPGTKPKGTKKIDDGKIKALWEAGWTIAAIADEMKLSAPTVRAHLVKMGVDKWS